MSLNRQIVLKTRPQGIPTLDIFELVNGEIPALEDGEFVVRNRFFSIEPAIRGWLDDRKSYFPPVALGAPIRSSTIGVVTATRNSRVRTGDVVRGIGRWEDFSVFSDETILLERIAPASDIPLSYYIGALGVSGFTAYVGLHDIGSVAAGQTVVVSAAAGAVGSVAVQIARLRGCRVIGLVGSAEKAAIAGDQLGCHEVVNYRETTDLTAAIDQIAPDGVDIYFDNVGGPILDAMLLCMKTFGRIVNCGMIESYNHQDTPPPIYNLWEMIARELSMRGFLVATFGNVLPEALTTLEGWVRSGELKVMETKRVGLEATPQLFCDLMTGQTKGKSVLELP